MTDENGNIIRHRWTWAVFVHVRTPPAHYFPRDGDPSLLRWSQKVYMDVLAPDRLTASATPSAVLNKILTMSSVLTQTVSGTPIPATCGPLPAPSTTIFAGWEGNYEREIRWDQSADGCPAGYYASTTSGSNGYGGSCVYWTGPGTYPKTYTGYCVLMVYTTSTTDIIAATTTVAPPDATSTTDTYVTVTQTNLVTATSTYVEMPGAARIAYEEKRKDDHNSSWTESEDLRGPLEKRQNVQPPKGSYTSYFNSGNSACSWLNGNFVTCDYGCCK